MAKSSNKNNFLIQGSILAISSILSRFIGMLYRIPLTNIVGDVGMGYYGSAYELYNLALILSSYSIPVAVSKLVSMRESDKQYRNAFRVFKLALSVAAIVGGLASVIVYLAADAWAKLVGDMPVAIPLRVLAPTIFVFAIMGVFRGYFQGKRTMIPTAFSQLLEQIVNAFVSVFAAYRLMQLHNASVDVEAYGAAGGTMGSLVGAIAGLVFLLFIYALNHAYIHKKVRKDRTPDTESYSELFYAFLVTVIPIILSQTVYQLSGTIDNAIFGQVMERVAPGEDTSLLWGLYSNKYRLLTNLPVAVATALGTSIVPALSKTYVAGDRKGVRHKIASAVKFNMLIAIPAAVGMGVLAKPIILLLFSNTEIELSAKLLTCGSVAIVFFAYSTLTNGILQGINRMKQPVYHAAISLAIHVGVLFLLLSVFELSVYGLVIGNVFYAFCVSVLNWNAIQKYAHYRQEVLSTFVMPLICSAVMGAVAYLVYQGIYRLCSNNLAALLPAVLLAVLVYGLMLVFTKTISEQEILGFPKGNVLLRILQKMHLV